MIGEMVKLFFFQSLISLAFSMPNPQSKQTLSHGNLKDFGGLEEEIFYSLRLPHNLAVENLSKWGKEVHDPLKGLAFNEKMPMRTRWKSFMVYIKLAGFESVPSVKQALEDNEWFMRNAGLTALEQIDSSLARKWAMEKLEKDPALMVRDKAVDILSKNLDSQVRDLFWKKLHSPDSFYNKRSLWIRRKLAVPLMENLKKGEGSHWVRLLYGEDDELKQMAVFALSKINDHPTINKDVSYWKDQYPKPQQQTKKL